MKRFIAKFLAFVILFTTLDLSWCVIDVDAAAIAKTVFDVEAELRDKIPDEDKSAENILNLNTYKQPVHTDTNNPNLYDEDDEYYSGTTLGEQPITEYGIRDTVDSAWSYATTHRFEQKTPDGTVQVKSGEWLDDSEFEAMQGTPTTESVFVTMGGTQWIVDLQYRLVSVPYVRRYHLDAEVANYRYYKLGEGKSGNSGNVSWVAQLEYKASKDPTDYIHYYANSGSNYAYKYHEGGGPNNSPVPGNTFNTHGTTYYTADKDGFCVGGAFSNAKIAPVSNVIAAGEYTQSTQQTTPTVARATLYKQQVYNAIKAYKEMWKQQDDNYRADQGIWDTTDDYYNSPDELGFMYSYAGMVRKTRTKGNSVGHSGGTADPFYIESNVSENIWQPYFVSYLYDYKNYFAEDSMSSTHGSDVPQLKRVSECMSGNALKSAIVSASNGGKAPDCFDFQSVRTSPYGMGSALEGTSWNPLICDNTILNTLVSRVGDNALCAFSDPDNAVAFSTTYNGPDMQLNTGHFAKSGTAVSMNIEMPWNKVTFNMNDSGYVEIADLYYRSVYSLFLNYSGLFYEDEVTELFDGLPGFDASKLPADYNARVNKNLAALFSPDRASANEINMTTEIPFAIFPLGGDLDGVMESSRSQAYSYKGGLSPVQVATAGTIVREHMYYVTIETSLNTTVRQYATTEKEYVTRRHNYEDYTEGAEHCYGALDGGCSNGKDTVNKLNLTVHTGTCLDSGCSTCGKNVIKCTTCGGDNVKPCTNTSCDGGKIGKSAGTSCTACGGDGKVGTAKCTACNGTGIVGKSDGTDCTTCGGDGEMPCDGHGTHHYIDCPDDLSPHTHYWLEHEEKQGRAQTNQYGDKRLFKHKVTTSANYSVTKNIGNWVESPKYMEYHDIIAQKFTDVNWIDIMSYNLWQLDSGHVKGLNRLLSLTSNAQSEVLNLKAFDYDSQNAVASELLTKAVDKLGFHVYNLDDGDSSSSSLLHNGYTDDLQRKGRLANSWNWGSYGNVDSTSHRDIPCPWTGNYGAPGGAGIRHNKIFYSKKADVPLLTSTAGSNGKHYVNNDNACFYVVASESPYNDDVYLRYDPYNQGGRSHTTFEGFINQALALTFMYDDSANAHSSVKSNAPYLTPYCNSVIIQGDYLTVDKLTQTELPIVGFYHDTWTEDDVLRNVSSESINQYSLINKETVSLLQPYYSTCKWIPARLSYIYTRVSEIQLYDGHSGAPNNNNHFMIHSYCAGINKNIHTPWDAIQVADSTMNNHVPGICTGGATCEVGNRTDKGSVYSNSCSPIKISSMLTPNVIDGTNGTIIDLQPFTSYTQNTYDKRFLQNGVEMPYVGYGATDSSTYISNKIITLDGEVDGYAEGEEDIPFDRLRSFVETPQNTAVGESSIPAKSFKRFGVTAPVKGTEIFNDYTGKSFGNKHPREASNNAALSNWYPWLSGLNINRYLNNGLYESTYAYNVYSADDEFSYTDPSKSSIFVNTTVEPKIVCDYDRNVNGTTDANENNKANDIVIYNPVASQSTTIVPLSEFLPDASNRGLDENNNYVYLGNFGNYLKRDTRLAERTDIQADGKHEQYISGQGVLSQSTKVAVEKSYELLERSKISTTTYNIDTDYNVSTTVDVQSKTWNNNDMFTATVDGTYFLTLADFSSGSSENYKGIKVKLDAGDSLIAKNNQTISWRGNCEYKLTFASFVEAYNTYLTSVGKESELLDINSTVPVNLTDNMYITIGTGSYRLRKGAVFKLSIPVISDTECTTNNPAIKLTSNITNCNVTTTVRAVEETTGKKYYHDLVVELKEDADLCSFTFDVVKNCSIAYFNSSAFTMEDVDLLVLNTGISDNSWKSFTYSASGSYDRATWYYNEYLTTTFDYSMKLTMEHFEERRLIVVRALTNTSLSVKNDALNDPHKVPDTLFGYYILGWQTSDGYVIDKVDTDLSDGVDVIPRNTILRLPGGPVSDSDLSKLTSVSSDVKALLKEGYITYNTLIDWSTNGKLFVYRTQGGSYGLLFDYDTFGRYSILTGYNTSQFSIEYFREDNLTEETVELFRYSDLGMSDSTKYFETKVTNSKGETVTCTQVEVLFKATTFSQCAYYVGSSLNSFHKIKVLWDGWENDWQVVDKIIPTFTSESYESVFGEYLSLDDEFTIYWDNYADLIPYQVTAAGNPIPNTDNGYSDSRPVVTSTKLGRGWDNSDHAIEGLGNMSVPETTVNKSLYWKTYNNLLTGIASRSKTDCTKWLKEKYIIFNVDMYGFTEGPNDIVADGTPKCFNPTTPAFKENGTPNKIVYIPAGTPVHLGYLSNSNVPTDDDNAYFVDYGARMNNTNKDPNGDNYTYHFWCPLSIGEMSQTATVQFVATGINDTYVTSDEDSHSIVDVPVNKTEHVTKSNIKPASLGLARADGSMFDEWGHIVVTAAGITNLSNSTKLLKTIPVDTTGNTPYLQMVNHNCYRRTHDSVNSTSISVIGRLGGLTVIDTGDPRYQDTFKFVEHTSETYAIAPIVKKVLQYTSNWKFVNNLIEIQHGSQYRYLSDSSDVRGRLIINSDTDRLSQDEVTKYALYKQAPTGSTYYSQFYKTDMYATSSTVNQVTSDVIETFRLQQLLPMSYDFNIHKEIREQMTVTKLGYELYCSLDCIGSYFGSSGPRGFTTTGKEETYVNNNFDYGQTKVQVHPMYVAINVKSKKCIPVDVYMRKGRNYELINAGSMFASESEYLAWLEKHPDSSPDGGPYYLDDAYNAAYVSSIMTNSDGYDESGYILSQEVLRRSIDKQESSITYNLLHPAPAVSTEQPRFSDPTYKAISRRVTTSLLDPNDYTANGDDEYNLGSHGLDYSYNYGNAQILFLREFNRTFVGGRTSALQQQAIPDNDYVTSVLNTAEIFGQRYHFGVGLPASAVFIEHGKKITEKELLTVDDGWYILCVIDIYAIGDKWILEYNSNLSTQKIGVGGKWFEHQEWNVYYERFKNLIPLTIYAPGETSASDKDTHGTH